MFAEIPFHDDPIHNEPACYLFKQFSTCSVLLSQQNCLAVQKSLHAVRRHMRGPVWSTKHV